MLHSGGAIREDKSIRKKVFELLRANAAITHGTNSPFNVEDFSNTDFQKMTINCVSLDEKINELGIYYKRNLARIF